MTTDESATRLLVLGAGPGGYPAAFLATEMGMDVTLVDVEANPGGVCLYRGCIPSKTLLHVAHVLDMAEQAKDFGVDFAEPSIDLSRLREGKNGVISKMTGGLGQLSRARKVKYVQGRGRFADAHTLRVANDSELTDVGFDYAIIATGSFPAAPRALQIDSDRVWDSTAALDLKVVPGRLLVVGGGYIGLELGSVYAALGSAVTVVEMTGGLLPGADRDLVDVVHKRVTERVQQILLNTTVVSLEERREGIVATLSGVETENEQREFDRVLVAVGRRPNSADLGLESLAVTVNERGFIETDVQRRTGEPSIFAIGDVAGEPMLAHKATHEARTAVEAIAGEPSAFAPAAIPAVVFTDPELAWTGLTETAARIQGIDIDVSSFPWGASGRATTIDRNDGLTKLIMEPGTERVLGVGIVGSGAGELIGEATLAVEMGARADDLRMTIHAHPTLSETVMEAAELFFNTSPHYIGRRR
jgi:dihydrolipoamide dehydrogenase